MNNVAKVALGAFCCTLVACGGYAELVQRDQAGGVLALKGQRQKAMEDADHQMASHCGGGYTIVAEENVVVGQRTKTQGREDSRESRRRSSTRHSEETVTTDVKEYRITYQCGGDVGPASAQAAPAQSLPEEEAAPAEEAPAESAGNATGEAQVEAKATLQVGGSAD